MVTWKRTFYAAWVAQLLAITGFSFVLPFIPLYIRDLGVTDQARVVTWAGNCTAASAFSLALFFWVLTAGGWQWGQDLGPADPLYRSATGIALASILLMQIGNLFGRRSRFGSGIDRQAFRNPLLVAGILIEIVFAWAILYFPPVQHVLGTGPVPLYVYAVAWLGAPLIFGLDFARKQIAKRLPMAAWGPVSP